MGSPKFGLCPNGEDGRLRETVTATVDFLVPATRLVIEVDGGYHRTRRVADARRERALRRLGYRVLRLEAELVLGAPGEAVARVRAALKG